MPLGGRPVTEGDLARNGRDRFGGLGWAWLGCLFGTGAAAVMADDPFIAVLLAVFWLFRRKALAGPAQEKLFLVSLLARASIMILVTADFSGRFGIPVIYTGGDSESHFGLAEKLTAHFRLSNLWNPPLDSSHTFGAGTYNFGPLVVFHTGYVFFLSVFGHLSDLVHAHSKYTFILADTIIGSMVPVLTYDIALIAAPERDIAEKSGYLMAWYPLAIMLSGIFLKDSLATFLLLAMVKALFYSKRPHYMRAIAAWLWLVLVRYKSGVFILPLLIAKWLFPKPAYHNWAEFKAEFRSLRVRGAMALGAVPAAVFVAKMKVLSTLAHLFVSSQEIMERTTVQGLTLVVYGLPGPLKALGMLGLSMTMPVPPWRSLSVPDKFFAYTFFSDLGALYWYVCIPFVLIGVWVVIRERRHDILLAGAFLFIMISMALSYWVDDRRRLMALPFGFILCAIGYQARSRYTYFLVGFAGAVVFSGLAYVALKV